MKLRQLEAMRAVCARGTTTHAAETLGLTQSAVSRLIVQLEDEVGLRLFDRRHGRLQITPEGQHFYAIAEKVLAGVDQISATARDIRTLQAGTLRIIAMPALGYGLLPDTIAKLKTRYRQVKISVDFGTRPELEKGLANATYDFGIATLPVDHELLEVEPLCGVNSVCVLPLGHQLADRPVIHAADLEGLPFVSMESAAFFRYRIDELFGRLGIRRILNIEAQSTIMVCNLVAKGLGVSIVHPFIAEPFAHRLLVRPFEPAIRFDYGLLFPAGQTRSQITNEFVKTLQDSLASLGRDTSGFIGLDTP
jgi:DNA-binding transcriptional LysR family regulator